MPYVVFCNRLEKRRSGLTTPEPHMTYDAETEEGARQMALDDARWHASVSGEVAEVVLITNKQWWASDWPAIGQKTPEES